MQMTLFYKMAVTVPSGGVPVIFESPAFQTGENAAVLVMLQGVSAVGGGTIAAQMQTSGDGEIYTAVGAPIPPVVPPAFGSLPILAAGAPYQKFMRAQLTASAGAGGGTVVFSLFVNLLPST